MFVKGYTPWNKGKPAWNKGLKGIQVSWNKGLKTSEETKKKQSIARKGKSSWNKGLKGTQVAWNKGVPMSDELKRKLSDLHKGKPAWNKGLKGAQIAWNKGIPNFNNRGEKNHLWKGGVTPEHTKIRNSIEYRLWREAVFARDNWTCLFCNARGGLLNADHIKPFSLFPELRFAIDNGRTLCIKCHFDVTKDQHKNGLFVNSVKTRFKSQKTV